MNAAGTLFYFIVPCADNNAVVGVFAMQPDKISAIERHNGTIVMHRKFQHKFIFVAGLSGILHSENVVTQLAQRFRYAE